MLIDPDRHPRLARIAGSPEGADVRPLREHDRPELVERAEDTRDGWTLRPGDDRTWDPGSDELVEARNAHHTNTADDMHEALGDPYDWLEGDLRVDSRGQLVMAHDADDEGDGLTLAEWLEIGAAGERGLKVDIKEIEALPGLLSALEASGVPQGRLMVNVGDVSRAQLREIRSRLPEAWIALNPSSEYDGYDDEELKRVGRLADYVGGRFAFPVRWDLIDDRTVELLKPHGKVSVWTSKGRGTPDDPKAERERLIERGVDGVIDLGAPSGTVQKVKQFFVNVWESEPVQGVRELGEDAVNLGRRTVSGGVELARDGVDLISDGFGAVGGLFD